MAKRVDRGALARIDQSASGIPLGSTIVSAVDTAEGGYEYTGAFTDRTTGTAGTDFGSSVQYTQEMVDAGMWRRFGFDSVTQLNNDVPYWTDPTPASASGVGLFGGAYMPGGVASLYAFDFDDSADPSGYSVGSSSGDFQYTSATGSYNFTQCNAGDLALVRFDFNVIPQVANTTVEIAMIWATRAANDDITFKFALTGDPIFFGEGTVGKTFLNRPILSAYFASNEDVNARALVAVRADQQCLIQPLTTLCTILR